MPFEDELGEALRRAGDGFTADRLALVDAGEQRGRRLVARRRASVIGGSVLALALIGTAGAYTGGLLDGSGSGRQADVAAPPALPNGGSGKNGSPDPKRAGAGTGAVTAEKLLAAFKALLPGGKLTDTQAHGTDQPPMVSGVYDDGGGKAAISVYLSRVDPNGSNARQLTECGDKNLQGYDDCRTEQLADGSKLLLHQGYEYPDRRVDTKVWRAVLLTPQGFMVHASESNAPAEKGAPDSRPNPPLTTAQLKALVTSAAWLPALNDLPPAEREQAQPESSGALAYMDAEAALERQVARYGLPVGSKGGEGGYGYVVLDDGKGMSLVQLNVTKNETASGFKGADVTTQPDGTKVKVTQRPTEKGKGVVEWTVDTLRTNGLRVVVSAYNTANQSGAATRETPALTLEQLKEMALAPGWNRAENS
ncbi:hypothetical protein ACGFYQ_18840 [Streptomyces sp. NPDC048258]|uniref:hypothetical protein n=1 Tax=Streptomyces sp. NPDC048258 TaxID=3365527 RepID=UPI00371A280D